MNTEVAKFIDGIGRSVISHGDIAHGAPQLFREDGVHLSDLGVDRFWPILKKSIVDVWKPG